MKTQSYPDRLACVNILFFVLKAFPRYYPENNQAKYDDGQLTVSLQSSEDIGNDITLRRFIATDNMVSLTINL